MTVRYTIKLCWMKPLSLMFECVLREELCAEVPVGVLQVL